MEFAYDGGGLGKGGAVTLYYDGAQVGEGRVEATQPFIFSADETTDVGYDAGTPVSADTPTGRFTGTMNWVQLDVGTDTHDHLVDPDHLVSVAMSLQCTGSVEHARPDVVHPQLPDAPCSYRPPCKAAAAHRFCLVTKSGTPESH